MSSGVTLNTDCVTCGAEAELYRGGRCMHCELNVVVDGLLADPNTGKIAPELVATSCKELRRLITAAGPGMVSVPAGPVSGVETDSGVSACGSVAPFG